MKKRFAALALACVTALSGCGDNFTDEYGTDMPKKYDKFLNYTFNNEYEIELKAEETYANYDSESDKTVTNGYRRWIINYDDKNGYAHEMELYGTLHESTGYEQFDKIYDDLQMYQYTLCELRDIASCELYNGIVRKYFDAGEWQGDDSFIYSTDEFMMQAVTFDVTSDVIGYESNHDLIEPVISPKTGICLADCTLTEQAQRKEVFTFVRVYVFNAEKLSQYIEGMDQLINDYLSLTDKPQNCHFDLEYCNRSGEEINFQKLTDRTYFLGEQTVISKGDKEGTELYEYEDILIEKLGYERSELMQLS